MAEPDTVLITRLTARQQVEMFYHRSGYRMQGEPMASHSRKRYRLLPTNPNIPNCDPSLFLIHYSRAAQRDIVPAASIPIPPQLQHQIQQRRIIQGQGQLARKEFMLHDRSNWPTINAPQAVARSQGGHRRGPSHGNEATLEEEEDVSRGDVLDFMSPRDISRVRYEQHHEWMEEILESPYNIFQIVPGDLGLGRKGELETLTKDFFDAPVAVLRETSGNSDPPRVGRLKNGKADDFNKRATQKIADMEAEIEKLKRQHQARVDRLKRTSVLNTAEKKLRAASSVSERRVSNTNSADQQSGDALDEIAQEVEGLLHKKIEQVTNVTMVQRGGLEDRAPPRSLSMSSSNKPQMSPVKTSASPSVLQAQNQALNGLQSPAQPMQTPPVGTETNGADAMAVPNATGQGQPDQPGVDHQDTPGGGGSGQELDLADNVDLDIDMDGLDTGIGNDDDDLVNPDNDWVMDMDTEQVAESNEDQTAQQANQTPETTGLQPEPSTESKGAEQIPTPSGQTPNMGTPADQGQSEQQLEGDEFGEAFGDADTAGDALASYGDGNDEDLNLDDSAFGDAFHQDQDDLS